MERVIRAVEEYAQERILEEVSARAPLATQAGNQERNTHFAAFETDLQAQQERVIRAQAQKLNELEAQLKLTQNQNATPANREPDTEHPKQHKEQIQALQAEHEKIVANLHLQFTLASEKQQEALTVEHCAEIDALKQRYEAETAIDNANLQTQYETRHSAEIAAIQRRHEDEIAILKQRIEDKTNLLSSMEAGSQERFKAMKARIQEQARKEATEMMEKAAAHFSQQEKANLQEIATLKANLETANSAKATLETDAAKHKATMEKSKVFGNFGEQTVREWLKEHFDWLLTIEDVSHVGNSGDVLVVTRLDGFRIYIEVKNYKHDSTVKVLPAPKIDEFHNVVAEREAHGGVLFSTVPIFTREPDNMQAIVIKSVYKSRVAYVNSGHETHLVQAILALLVDLRVAKKVKVKTLNPDGAKEVHRLLKSVTGYTDFLSSAFTTLCTQTDVVKKQWTKEWIAVTQQFDKAAVACPTFVTPALKKCFTARGRKPKQQSITMATKHSDNQQANAIEDDDSTTDDEVASPRLKRPRIEEHGALSDVE